MDTSCRNSIFQDGVRNMEERKNQNNIEEVESEEYITESEARTFRKLFKKITQSIKAVKPSITIVKTKPIKIQIRG